MGNKLCMTAALKLDGIRGYGMVSIASAILVDSRTMFSNTITTNHMEIN